LLPPKVDIETKRILRKTISAGRALAQLNGTFLNLPNPTLFLDTIYLQEAKASSEVENIITTNDELYKSLVAVMGKFKKRHSGSRQTQVPPKI